MEAAYPGSSAIQFRPRCERLSLPLSPSAAFSLPVSTLPSTDPFTMSTSTTVPSRLVPNAYFPSEVDEREVIASGCEAISCNGSASDDGSNIRR